MENASENFYADFLPIIVSIVFLSLQNLDN